MSIDFRYPNVTGRNEKEQIAQIRSYLFQLVDQLNYAFPVIDTTIAQNAPVRGKDYWTDSDKNEIVNAVLAKLEKTQGGTE